MKVLKETGWTQRWQAEAVHKWLCGILDGKTTKVMIIQYS